MATVINHPADSDPRNDTTTVGVILGIIVALIVIAAILIYGIPAMQSRTTVQSPAPPNNVNIELPTTPVNPVPNTGTEMPPSSTQTPTYPTPATPERP